MHLFGELDGDQLKPLLDDDDIKEVLASDIMFLRCVYVILAYLSDPSPATNDGLHAQDDPEDGEHHPHSPPASAVHLVQARCASFMVISIAPAITITGFAPAKPYIATLMVVSLVWFAVLPISLVDNCRQYVEITLFFELLY